MLVSAFELGVARHILQEEARRQLKSVEISRHWEIHRSIPSAGSRRNGGQLRCNTVSRKMQPERRKLLGVHTTSTAATGKQKCTKNLRGSTGLRSTPSGIAP